MFQHHCIRSNLLLTWQRYFKRNGEEWPLWISPLEVITTRIQGMESTQVTYRDLTERKAGKRVLLPLEKWPIKVDWFQHCQIKNLFEMDSKKYGFKEQDSNLEGTQLKGENKIVSKIYKLLITWFTEEQVEKESMIKWAVNCNKTIEMGSWEYLWKTAQKISVSTRIQENLFKMQYPWHLALKKLSCTTKSLPIKCWKCEQLEGSYFHMWWTNKAKNYWAMIHTEMCHMLGYVFT